MCDCCHRGVGQEYLHQERSNTYRVSRGTPKLSNHDEYTVSSWLQYEVEAYSLATVLYHEVSVDFCSQMWTRVTR